MDKYFSTISSFSQLSTYEVSVVSVVIQLSMEKAKDHQVKKSESIYLDLT